MERTPWIGRTVTVTDSCQDVFQITLYADHALVTTSNDKGRNGPIVKLGPKALDNLFELLSAR